MTLNKRESFLQKRTLAPTNLLNISFIPLYGRLSDLNLFNVVTHSFLWVSAVVWVVLGFFLKLLTGKKNEGGKYKLLI